MSAHDYLLLYGANAIQIVLLLYLCGVVTLRLLAITSRLKRLEQRLRDQT